jgi:DeoR/GlpR family transcriptional regulator of sugar metabolism
MAARSGVDIVRKRALARAAAATVRRGELLFLDNGSTHLALAELLPEDHELTVATNSVDIAAALLRRADLRLLLIGGVVDPTVGGCVDATALLALQRLDIARAFVGACAISAETGASAHDAADAEFKRALLAASREHLVLVTNDKLGTRAPHRFAALQALGTVLVEHDADSTALAAAGATIQRADAPV